jgi:5-methylcytosine-specific restriction endonuclease McrA
MNSRPEGEKRLYTYRWQQASKAFLAEHPLCMCPYCKEGALRVRASSVVDHDPPHRGDYSAFWNRDSWRALAKQCHDSYKQRLEKSGRMIGADGEGVPIDPNHPWNQSADGIGG